MALDQKEYSSPLGNRIYSKV